MYEHTVYVTCVLGLRKKKTPTYIQLVADHLRQRAWISLNELNRSSDGLQGMGFLPLLVGGGLYILPAIDVRWERVWFTVS